MKTHQKQSQQGSIAIEAIISLVILSVSTLALTQLQSHVYQGVGEASRTREATSIIHDALEVYRAFQTLTQQTGKLAYTDITSKTATLSNSRTIYTEQTVVTDDPNGQYKTVNMALSWTNADNSQSATSSETVVYQHDASVTGNLFRTKAGAYSLP